MNKLTITWHGHSCFTISCNGYDVVLDPYAPGSVPGLPELSLTADMVLCSHEHSDHGYTQAVQIRENGTENPFQITKIDTFHDDASGSMRGPNRIHILEAGGLKAVHLGDLGCGLTAMQADLLKKPDILLIPVGGYYTIDAAQAAEIVERLSPRVTVPMHYRSDTFGYPVIGRLEEYTSRCSNEIIYDTNVLTVDERTRVQTAILTLA